MNDKQILKSFEENASVADFLKSWTPESKIDFCNLARIVHAAGFDWWQTNVVGEVARFGRKHKNQKEAKFVIGIVNGKRSPILRVNGLGKGNPKISRQPVTALLHRKVEKTLFSPQITLSEKFKLSDKRNGYWPSEYLTEKSTGSNNSENGSINSEVFSRSYGDEWEELEKILRKKDISDSTKMALVLSRVGQGKFREMVIKRANNKCDVTGLENTKVLMASHILAWKDCKSTKDRLNPNNGLLLTPNLDKLFDRGFISFNENGDMLVKSDKDEALVRELHSTVSSFDTRLKSAPSKKQMKFLRLHQKNNKAPTEDWRLVQASYIQPRSNSLQKG